MKFDLHLHPSWQQRVLIDLMRAFPATQFIVTTHSPQLLTTLRAENIRMLREDEAEGWQALTSEVSPLAHEPGDALAFLMNTHPKPDIEGVTSLVKQYEKFAHDGLVDSIEAQELEEKLKQVGYQLNDADKALFSFLAKKKRGGLK